MNRILPFCSGKGGVGKSLLLSNIAIALSRLGKTVIMMDMDLGGANLHTFLGIKNNQEGMGNYLTKGDIPLESLVYGTDREQLYFIPGDNLLPGTANHPYYLKKRLQKEIRKLTADYILMDLGAGSSYNVVDYMLMSLEPLLVVNPEPSSILNAYSLIKTALFRLFFSNLPAKSLERLCFHDLCGKKMEGKEWNWQSLSEEFLGQFPNYEDTLESIARGFNPQILINMGRHRGDLDYCLPLRAMCKRNLSLDIRYAGFFHYEEQMQQMARERRIFFEANPRAPLALDVQRFAESLTKPRSKGDIDISLLNF